MSGRGHYIDLTGQKFGKWTVVERCQSEAHNHKSERVYWLCKCDCGNTVCVISWSLIKGFSVQCDDCRRHSGSPRYKQNLIGQRFGHMVVIEELSARSTGGRKWLCKCDCGNTCSCAGGELAKGYKTTCGECSEATKTKKATDIEKFKKGFFLQIKNNANQRGINFSLIEDECVSLATSKCYYCGREPQRDFIYLKIKTSIKYNGIDRLDSNKGYSPENCVPCCYVCNLAKRDMNADEFLSLVKIIYEHKELNNYSIGSLYNPHPGLSFKKAKTEVNKGQQLGLGLDDAG